MHYQEDTLFGKCRLLEPDITQAYVLLYRTFRWNNNYASIQNKSRPGLWTLTDHVHLFKLNAIYINQLKETFSHFYLHVCYQLCAPLRKCGGLVLFNLVWPHFHFSICISTTHILRYVGLWHSNIYYHIMLPCLTLTLNSLWEIIIIFMVINVLWIFIAWFILFLIESSRWYYGW